MRAAVFFLILGLVCLVLIIFKPRKKITLVLLVQNLEERVEGILRTFYLLPSSVTGIIELIVVDCCSSDATPAILRRLQRQLPVRIVFLAEPLPKEQIWALLHREGVKGGFYWARLTRSADWRLLFWEVVRLAGKRGRSNSGGEVQLLAEWDYSPRKK